MFIPVNSRTAQHRRGRVLTIVLLVIALSAVAFAVMAATGSWSAGTDVATPRDIADEFRASLSATQSPEDQPRSNPTGAPRFTDVTTDVGISFQHDNAFEGNYYLPEEMGPGAGFLDYDNDGDMDLYIAGGGTLTGDGPVQRCQLYRNDDGAFVDVSAESGADILGHAFGVGCADIDNDGDTDIYVTRLGANRLLVNQGDGTFVERGTEAGVADDRFGASVCFFDYDKDGFLDLYVTNYVGWSEAIETPCYTILGQRDYCGPKVYDAPLADVLYRNRGDGTFEDVSELAGIAMETGNGLGVVAHDFDGDGWCDLYVANDQTPAFLWKNNGDGTFENIAHYVGAAYDRRGVAISGMGVAAEDLDADGEFDLLITNIIDQNHLVLISEKDGFTDRSMEMGLGNWSTPWTAFGVVLFDQNHDGHLDGLVTNGAVNINAKAQPTGNPYSEPDQFVSLVNGRFVDQTPGSGVDVNEVGRGLCSADYDNDGDIDVLITNNGGPAVLLRNNHIPDRAGEGAWLMVDARHASGRPAIGAIIEVHTADRVFVRQVTPQQSYLCSNDPRVHFGLGEHDQVEQIIVKWVNGTATTIDEVAVNQKIQVNQPEPSGASS